MEKRFKSEKNETVLEGTINNIKFEARTGYKCAHFRFWVIETGKEISKDILEAFGVTLPYEELEQELRTEIDRLEKEKEKIRIENLQVTMNQKYDEMRKKLIEFNLDFQNSYKEYNEVISDFFVEAKEQEYSYASQLEDLRSYYTVKYQDKTEQIKLNYGNGYSYNSKEQKFFFKDDEYKNISAKKLVNAISKFIDRVNEVKRTLKNQYEKEQKDLNGEELLNNTIRKAGYKVTLEKEYHSGNGRVHGGYYTDFYRVVLFSDMDKYNYEKFHTIRFTLTKEGIVEYQNCEFTIDNFITLLNTMNQLRNKKQQLEQAA